MSLLLSCKIEGNLRLQLQVGGLDWRFAARTFWSANAVRMTDILEATGDDRVRTARHQD